MSCLLRLLTREATSANLRRTTIILFDELCPGGCRNQIRQHTLPSYRAFGISLNNSSEHEPVKTVCDIISTQDKEETNTSNQVMKFKLPNELSTTSLLELNDNDKLSTHQWEDENEIDILAETETPTILEPYTKPALATHSSSLSSFILHSPTLQKLLDLGVDLYKVQKQVGAAEMILKMDFDRDIKDKIGLLHHLGIPSDSLGTFLTKNPHILGEELADLEVRVEYLKSKKFSTASITSIVRRAPYFLCFTTQRVDRKIGYFQKEFQLTGDEVRKMITQCPQLVTYKISRIQENMFVIHHQLGFSKRAMKQMVLKQPKLLLTGKQKLMELFDYIHNAMDIPHHMFSHFPAVLRTRLFKIKERNEYLKTLCLAQYDPKKPGYVPLQKLVEGSDEVFSQEIAKTSLQDYNVYLKTV